MSNEAKMKVRPILFSAPMVRAILEGRKTVTRRILKVQPEIEPMRWKPFKTENKRASWAPQSNSGKMFLNSTWGPICCPYGQPGDQLWVRETFCIGYALGGGRFTAIPFSSGECRAFYRATDDDKPDEAQRNWKPSIYMPRWASRINLEVTGIKVERLQDITAEEAIAEGIEWFDDFRINDRLPPIAYRALWESINGTGSWDLNPWVWCVSFKRIVERKS